MKKYIVIVRDFSPYHSQPSDTYLIALNMYYVVRLLNWIWKMIGTKLG